MNRVPSVRIVPGNMAGPNRRGDYVLYWMTCFARTRWNFSLQRAVEWTRELRRPLLVLHILYCENRWDSDRLHTFALDGMRDIARELDSSGVRYYPYVETRGGAARGLIKELAKRACVAVTDDFPSADIQRLISSEADGLPILLEKVDSNGVLPLRAAPRTFLTAASFRTFLLKNLTPHLEAFPQRMPLRWTGPVASTRKRQPAKANARASISIVVRKRWPPASSVLLKGAQRGLKDLRIDHAVVPVEIEGGMKAAESALSGFIKARLKTYAQLRNHPDEDATSGLSPYLHFGHISTHQILTATAEHLGLSHQALARGPVDSGKGWWGKEGSAQAFTDQLLTWREIGFNMAWQHFEYDAYESLPEWARRTLEAHARDAREYRYSLKRLEAARTHDRLWNAAQTQLVTEGRLHNYIRMLWGKKILEWTASPQQALEIMIELNNKYALDGRNPNSYSGIFWILGRYDRPWGPKRPIFGTIRYMRSQSTLRKVRVRKFMDKYMPPERN